MYTEQGGRKRSNAKTSTKSTYKRSKANQKSSQNTLYQMTRTLPHHACGYHTGVCSLDNAACTCSARGYCEKYCGCDPNTCTIRLVHIYLLQVYACTQ
jgi:hypothetical protein